MKRLIKATSDAPETILIPIEVEFVVDDSVTTSVTAAIATSDKGEHYVTIFQEKYMQEIEQQFHEFIRNTLSIFRMYGLKELEFGKSPRSDSMYYIAVYKNQMEEKHVKVVFDLRISDHSVPMFKKDKTQNDADKRQSDQHEEYFWSLYEKSEEIRKPFKFIYHSIVIDGLRAKKWGDALDVIEDRIKQIIEENPDR